MSNSGPMPPKTPTLTDHAVHLHQQVKETGVADGHIRLCVSQSDELHNQIVHSDSWSRNRANDRGFCLLKILKSTSTTFPI